LELGGGVRGRKEWRGIGDQEERFKLMPREGNQRYLVRLKKTRMNQGEKEKNYIPC